jgi:hypothetical protein
MGMFDWIGCDYPLPGEKLEFVKEFQSKCFDCVLANILITEDGRLVVTQTSKLKLDNFENFSGVIKFYGSNITAMSPAGYYTRNGEDAESVTYEAKFEKGKLIDIKQVSYEREPALASSEMEHVYDIYDRENRTVLKPDNISGSVFIYRSYLEEEGRYAEVVSQTKSQLCVKYDNDKLEIIEKYHIGHVVFANKEEAIAARKYRNTKIQEIRDEYKKKLKERKRKKK